MRTSLSYDTGLCTLSTVQTWRYREDMSGQHLHPLMSICAPAAHPSHLPQVERELESGNDRQRAAGKASSAGSCSSQQKSPGCSWHCTFQLPLPPSPCEAHCPTPRRAPHLPPARVRRLNDMPVFLHPSHGPALKRALAESAGPRARY